MKVIGIELHAIARDWMNGERRGHTLQATALVNEAFLRLANEGKSHWDSKAQFFVAAAEAMRRVLIDHARARGAAKRGGGRDRHELDFEGVLDLTSDRSPEEIVALDNAVSPTSSGCAEELLESAWAIREDPALIDTVKAKVQDARSMVEPVIEATKRERNTEAFVGFYTCELGAAAVVLAAADTQAPASEREQSLAGAEKTLTDGLEVMKARLDKFNFQYRRFRPAFAAKWLSRVYEVRDRIKPDPANTAQVRLWNDRAAKWMAGQNPE